MAGSPTARILAAVAALSLAGCGEGARFPLLSRAAATDDAPAEGGAAAGTTVEKDVEAPDVFSVSEAGLWDGRPSLGGVWVAHPDVADPERVIIRNAGSGQSVVGALFRRERNNPGPRIQVSSDAAAELGMLAGQPAALEVVALRREAVESEPVAAAETAPALPASAAPIAASTLAPPSAATANTAAANAASARTASARTALSAADLAAATAGSQPQPAAAPAAAPAALDKPYIQVGIFSVESNADDTAGKLRGAGIAPAVRAQQSSGKRFWRVIVGPAATADDRRATLARLRDLGFTDAYYVTN